nr:MAG TPA: hypothetical protein [Caudoviricetes sp.]
MTIVIGGKDFKKHIIFCLVAKSCLLCLRCLQQNAFESLLPLFMNRLRILFLDVITTFLCILFLNRLKFILNVVITYKCYH